MARGQQKIQSQQKAAERAQKLKKQQGHDQKGAASKALTFICVVCKVSVFNDGDSLKSSCMIDLSVTLMVLYCVMSYYW